MKLNLAYSEIEKVLKASGIPNYEQGIFNAVKEVLGSEINCKTENGMCLVEINPSGSPFILLGAHSDVLGGRVTEINKEGFIRFVTTGSSHVGWLNGRHVQIATELAGTKVIGGKGKETVTGVIAHKDLHNQEPEERNKVPKVSELFIDVGAKSKEEVEKLGITVGDPIIYSITPEKLLNDRVVCRGWDNRAGVLTLVETIRKIQTSNFRLQIPKVVFAFWGGEEVGLIGGHRGSHLFRPDIMINVDVGFATQTPGTPKEAAAHGSVDLGDGVIINRGAVLDADLVKQAYELSKKKKVKTQFSVVAREPGTDATPFNRTSSRVLDLGIPCRYMHYDEVVDLDDIASASSLIVELLKSF